MRLRTLVSAAVVTATASASLIVATPAADAARLRSWERLAHCESGGRWHINTGNGYYGGLQISAPTWRAYGGKRFTRLPHRASKPQQIIIAERIKRGQGWRAWPACSSRVGLR